MGSGQGSGSYRDLLVWQKAIKLVADVYKVTVALPADERFGLVSQMRRAAVSVPSNIAEGQARRTTRDFIHFVSQAEGSVAELETQVNICHELGFLDEVSTATLEEKLNEIRKMLNSLRRSLQTRADSIHDDSEGEYESSAEEN